MRDYRFWATVALLAVVCGLFAWEVSSGVEFVVDDSFITFSFSKNLARGMGPVYGHDVRVEGYSNFLWMALVAVPLVFAPSADPMALARGVAVPFALLLLGATYVLSRTRASRASSLVAAGIIAIDLDVVLAYRSGLETLPYVALLTSGFAAYARAGTSQLARRLVIPLFTAVALMRIDGFVPLGFVIAFEALTARAERRPSFFTTLRWAAPGVAVWAAWFAWRFAYYGLPLPSTYYAKALISDLLPHRGPEYVLDELTANGLFLALPAFGYLLWRRHRHALPVGLFALLQLTMAARVGGDWMPSARFVLPAVPLLVVLVAWATDELTKAARARARLLGAVPAVAALGAAGFVVPRIEPHVTTVPHQLGKLALAREQTRHVASLRRAASYLAEVVPPGGRLVTDYGGVLAYYTDASPIEMWGLCNATIATRGNTERVQPFYGRTCPACYPELDPEFFHTEEPLVRKRDAFTSHGEVVRAVWQTDTIGRYLDFAHGFVSGRIVNLRRGDAAWFLERARAGWQPHPRRPAPDFVIEYPFVPGGLLQD